MRSLMFLLVLVLFCSVQMTSSAPGAINAAQKCCEGFTNVKLPVKLVKSYFWSSSTCPIRAIVFQMISGKEICVDPETTWVNGHIAKVDKRTTSAATTSSTTTTSAATTSTTTTTPAATTSTTPAATTTTTTSTTSTTTAATTKNASAATTATTAKTQSPTVSRNSTVPI